MPHDELPCESVVHQLYDAFNGRRLDESAALFHGDAVLEHIPVGRQQHGPAGFLEFTAMWLRAFPDARVNVERTQERGPGRCEVELRATGTHEGTLDLGGYGLFKASGSTGELRLRQLIEIRDGRIAFSSLSFDVQDIVQQLVTVDVPALLKRLDRIRDLHTRVAGLSPDDTSTRRTVLDRLGSELDAARRLVRPYFDR